MSVSRKLGSLSFQVTAAYLGLALLLSGAGLYTIGAFQRQLAYDTLVDTAARLELTVEQMHAQGMNYKQNAPRDYPTYYRDVRLYYQDLLTHVETLDTVVSDFMRGDFRGSMPTSMRWLAPTMSSPVEAAIAELERVWELWRAGLFEALGDDTEEPRLEWAAEHVMEYHPALAQASETFAAALRDWADREYRVMIRGAIAVAILTLVLAATLLVLLHVRVLAPLRETISGFQRVADGDFSHRLPVTGTTETQDLTRSFNRLSARLDLLYQLIGRLQQGQDLDQLLGLLSRHFRELLGCDWIGVVFTDDARGSARVEASWLDGQPQTSGSRLYRLHGTLLEAVLEEGSPLHVTAMTETARDNPAYEFLRRLVALGMQDAIFLPLTPQTQTPIPAVIVFATRLPSGFDDAQVRLLGNSSQLLAQGFGRIARFAEQGRLAAIGEFASGIAHELRTPLSTVSMALSHATKSVGEDARAKRRLELGLGEAQRMQRLLEEILLYAKPLSLDLQPVDLAECLGAFIAVDEQSDDAHSVGLQTHLEHKPMILADRDRLQQIFANLSGNARDAAPVGSPLEWTITAAADQPEISLSLRNSGDPIPAKVLARLTEPFFSTKSGGTGLGLAIVRRLVEQHGGQLSIRSDTVIGTEVGMRFPRLME